MVVRDNPKQSWSKARTLPVKDVSQAWVDSLNESVGWQKYRLSAPA